MPLIFRINKLTGTWNCHATLDFRVFTGAKVLALDQAQCILKGFNYLIFVSFGQARRNRKQLTPFEQVVSHRAGSAPVVVQGVSILFESPRGARGVCSHLFAQCCDIEIDMQTVVCKNHVAGLWRRAHNRVKAQSLVDCSGRGGRFVDGNEKAAGVAVRVDEPAQRDLLLIFKELPHPQLTVTHSVDGCVHFSKLYPENSGAKFVKATSPAPSQRRFILKKKRTGKIPGTSAIMASDRASVELFVIGGNCSGLTRAHVLIHLETEDGNVSEAAYFFAAHRTACALSTVLKKKDSVFPGDAQDWDHIGLRPAHMYRDDSRGTGCNLAPDIGWVKAEGLIYLSQYGYRSQIDDCGHDRDPHIRRHDNFLTGPDL